MSTVHIKYKMTIYLHGRKFTSDVNEKVKVDIKTLNFNEKSCMSFETETGICYLLYPQTTSGISPLHKIFPEEEWEYTYYVYEDQLQACTRPVLFLKVHNKNKSDFVKLEFDDLTEEEYKYLREFYSRMFETDILTLEEYYRSNLDIYLLDYFKACRSGDEIVAFIKKDSEDYRSIRDMFYDMRAEYMDGDSTSFDTNKLYAVISREIMSALIGGAKQKT